MGIFEVFVIDDEVRFMINERASTSSCASAHANSACAPSAKDGVRKVLAGTTTAQEVIQTTMGDAE